MLGSVATIALLGSHEATTHRSQLIAVGIAYVGGIKVRCAMQPQPRSTLAHASICESSRMEIVDRFPRRRAECNHAAVAHRGALLIKWFADPECELPSPAVLVCSPPRGDTIPVRIASDTAFHT